LLAAGNIFLMAEIFQVLWRMTTVKLLHMLRTEPSGFLIS
jgi:hypothetical protein